MTWGKSTTSLGGGLASDLAATPAYAIRGVHFRYGAERPQGGAWVLQDVTLDVKQGEILGIVGPNGSGKTSLLKLLAKLATPQEGQIALLGRSLRELSHEEVAHSVAVVPQDSPQMFPFTVAETVLMGRFPHRRRSGWNLGFGWEDRDDCQAASQSMLTMDIAHLAGRAVTDVSGGERQRTMIARALTQAPRVLLLDEPTAFLDLQHQLGICSTLRRLCDESGLTVVIVSHDLNLASQYCDRVAMLRAGQVCTVGAPAEVMSTEVLREVYGCEVLIDRHPQSGLPRITLPSSREPAVRS